MHLLAKLFASLNLVVVLRLVFVGTVFTAVGVRACVAAENRAKPLDARR